MMKWRKEYLDLILVPSAMLVLFGYHAFLLFKCIHRSNTTVIGYDIHCNKTWVKKMMHIEVTKRGPAISVISSNITATHFMTSTTLTLTSLIGTFIAGSSSHKEITRFVYGDTRPSTYTFKYICVLGFFFVSYVSFLQSARYFIQTNYLISMPEAEVPVVCVQKAMIKGQYSWHIGLRSVYFASIMMTWVFGPIPMFVGALVLVVVLDFLDNNHSPLHEFAKPAVSINGGSDQDG